MTKKSNHMAFKELSFILSCSPRNNQGKASPLVLKSWIALALTLDGRDKITKLTQYICRLVAHYYESLLAASRNNGTICTISSNISSRSDSASSSSTSNIMEYYSAQSQSFRNLQNSLANARKAYRLGRTLIELDKLQSIGLGRWIQWHWRMNIVNRIINIATSVPPQNIQNDEKTPPRMHLPRKMSSNIGGPITATSISTTTVNANANANATTNSTPLPTLTQYRQRLSSHIVKVLYLSCSTFLDKGKDGEGDEKNGRNSNLAPPPSLWNVCLGTAKLVGLAGFWAADNVSYLYSSGFWLDGGKRWRARDATVVAARCYFLAAMSGLLLNLKEFVKFRNGPLREALLVVDDDDDDDDDDGTVMMNGSGYDGGEENLAFRKHERELELERRKEHLTNLKEKYVTISLALLKSICDVIVFSNNTGVDLHVKYRGKKMNETLHCACGITSALTVLYNNFPSSAKK
eukprot:CAMPEP_0176496090 /NCGR_PEP_ID=MMETSP0200_2-20121128/11013_1 /TAXON_ID=947934 /ORGANISM="Chaetoceros sp., Strain GSL56" /LENGTH=462 /DNA_ID=CAMNT_0017894029 /DNA_START=48 /DNA_END=1436 /DNA_ORIENTATION=+